MFVVILCDCGFVWGLFLNLCFFNKLWCNFDIGFLKFVVWFIVDECLSKFLGVCGELNKWSVLSEGGDSGGVVGLFIFFLIGDLFDKEFLKGFENLRF